MHDPAPDSARQAPARYRVGDLVVDLGRASVSRSGEELPLPRLSFDLLVTLVEAAPNIVTIDTLLEKVWAGLVVSPETISQRVKLLRQALGDDAKNPRYVGGIRGRGYRLVATVTREGAVPGDELIVSGRARGGREKPGQRSTAVVALGLGLSLLAALIVVLATRSRPPEAPADTRQAGPGLSIAVLPFEDLGHSAESAALAVGIAESVLHQLTNLREITVISRSSSFLAAHEQDDVNEIGRRLNVRFLLRGSVQSDASRLRVTAHLLESSAGRSIWSIQFDRPPEDIFTVQDEIALQVTRAMKMVISPDLADRLTQQTPTSFDAYLAYVQGRALLRSLRLIELPAAIRHFESAIYDDPRFAPAYVALAEARLLQAEHQPGADRRASFERALASADTLVQAALELDDQNGEAYIQRAFQRAYTDLAAAEADFRRGISLQPGNSRGYEGLAAVLYQDPARLAEAQEVLQRARDLDPLEPRIDVTMAILHAYGRGDVSAADRELQSALRKDPLYQPAISRLGEWRFSAGQAADAAKYGEQALALDPRSSWTRRYLLRAYLDMGEVDAAANVVATAPAASAAYAVPLHVYRGEWDSAASAAYMAAGNADTSPIDALLIAAAIRMDARHGNDLPRAADLLVAWSGTTWNESGSPVSGEPPGMRAVTIALADVLQLSGEHDDAEYLLRSVLADMDHEVQEFGRGDRWHFHTRPLALALLGDDDSALQVLEQAFEDGFGKHDWWYLLELEPAYERLRSDARFQQLLSSARLHSASQREQLARLRQAQVVPMR